MSRQPIHKIGVKSSITHYRFHNQNTRSSQSSSIKRTEGFHNIVGRLNI
jgi:hypothetical protein